MELTHEQLTWASESDIAAYNLLIAGLPSRVEGQLDKNGEVIPYGSGPHIIRPIMQTIMAVNPQSILEIGLNLGWSSALWLGLSKAKVFSIDNSDRDETIDAGATLGYKYPGRFEFLIWDSGDAYRFLKNKDFDLCFVDGSHQEDSVTKDIELAIKLDIPFILFDDIYPRYGPGVMKAIEKWKQLKLFKDFDNLRLYRNDIYE